MKTRKILDIHYKGFNYKGYVTDEQTFRLYKAWWDRGEHKRLIGKFIDFTDMVGAVNEIARMM